MRTLFLIALLGFSSLSFAAENDAPVQDAEAQDENGPVEQESVVDDDGSLALEDSDLEETEEESSARFIPTEEISQDLGVSFPIDI